MARQQGYLASLVLATIALPPQFQGQMQSQVQRQGQAQGQTQARPRVQSSPARGAPGNALRQVASPRQQQQPQQQQQQQQQRQQRAPIAVATTAVAAASTTNISHAAFQRQQRPQVTQQPGALSEQAAIHISGPGRGSGGNQTVDGADGDDHDDDEMFPGTDAATGSSQTANGGGGGGGGGSSRRKRYALFGDGNDDDENDSDDGEVRDDKNGADVEVQLHGGAEDSQNTGDYTVRDVNAAVSSGRSESSKRSRRIKSNDNVCRGSDEKRLSGSHVNNGVSGDSGGDSGGLDGVSRQKSTLGSPRRSAARQQGGGNGGNDGRDGEDADADETAAAAAIAKRRRRYFQSDDDEED